MKTILTVFFLITCKICQAQFYEHWTQQTSGTTQDLYSISASFEGVIWTCGANGTVLKSTNTGQNWQSAGSPLFSTLPLYNIYGFGSNSAIVTGSDGSGTYVYKTTNGGTNWVEVFSQAGGFINAIYVDNLNNRSYMQGDPVGGRWSLWKSTNLGTTWDSTGMYLPQTGSEAGWNNSLAVQGVNDIYFGTNNSRIYKSGNGGNNWVTQTTPEVNSYTLTFTFQYGLSGGSQLMRTENNGANWSVVTAPGTGNVSGSASVNFAFFFVRQGPGIYSSFNGGISWNTDTTITGAQFNDMASLITIITSSGYRIWTVGNDGLIYATDYLNSISQISSNLPDRYSLSQNYPNPFNPTSKIKFDITKADFVSLKIYNSLGQEVSKLVNENLTPGTYEVTFDGAGLNSGIYFYTIQSGDFVETKKMMLVK